MDGWQTQLASDVQRDGMGLELLSPKGHIAAEVFRSDRGNSVSVATWKPIPPNIFHWFLAQASLRLGPFDDGSPLPDQHTWALPSRPLKRPGSTSLAALVLGWFGIASAGAATMGALSSGPGFPLPTFILVTLAALGAICLATAVAMWTMNPVATRLLLVAGGAGALLSFAFPLTLSPPIAAESAWTAGFMGGALFALLCAWQSRRFKHQCARAV